MALSASTSAKDVDAAARGAVTQRSIPIDRIDPDPDQPRKHFDEVALAQLAESMRTIGQQQAITVRYDRKSRRYLIVMGERRWRAAPAAGLTELHAVVQRDLTDAEAFVRAVAENVGRADMTPLEEARAFHRLVAEFGHAVADVARMCGRAVEGVQYRIDLLDLTDAGQEALSKGHLPVGLAWYVSRLAADGQHMFLGKWVRGEFPSIADAEAFVQACRNAAAQAGLFAMAEMSHERKQQLLTSRKAVVAKVDRLAGAGAILAELGQMAPEELAQLLAGVPGGVGGYQDRIGHLHAAAAKALSKLRKAAAIAAVHAPQLHVDLGDAA